ncbi:MAG: zinc ribbon domain-containing protein [Chloroflexota bacterium]
MESQVRYLSLLALIDLRLDELAEDLGDLPATVRTLEDKLKNQKKMVDETKAILEEIKQFCANAKVTLVELKDREEKLAKQQFMVRNNKEFDAISKEIETIKQEHESLSSRLRTEGIKEDNLKRILEDQQVEYIKAENAFDIKIKEMNELTGDQNEEVAELHKKRERVIKFIKPEYFVDYNRIRTMHRDASVTIRKNSCTGCFSAVPAQKIVEIRNNIDSLFHCEHCGRILTPEEISVDESDLDEI